MLLLAAAVAKFSGDLDFLRKYDDLFQTWADYLADKGFDPDNQLCTDDFAGHLAHNANLSVKAILALAGYGMIAGMIGKPEAAGKFTKLAKKFASRWIKAADDGECFRLAFDCPGSWSQKYNLVWDRLLELNCFPSAVAEKELRWYRSHQNRYGLPLDSRKTYTKLDWILWSAVLSGRKSDFNALVKPVWKWLQEGVSRVPASDWYETVDDGRAVGFQARSVVGGCFMAMLDDPAIRKKWRNI